MLVSTVMTERQPRVIPQSEVDARRQERLKRGRKTKYDWQRYVTDGRWYEFVRGVDFHCKASSFRASAYSWAQNHNLHCESHTVETGEVIGIRFVTPGYDTIVKPGHDDTAHNILSSLFGSKGEE